MIQQFKHLLHQENVGDILKRNSQEKAAVKSLQQMLFELGFGNELRWKDFGADGDFGNGTSAAVRSFASRNGLIAPDDRVTSEIAKAISDKYEIASPLRTLHDLMHTGEIENVLVKGSPDEGAVSSLQMILNHMGFDEELNWTKFGADGDYGGGTTRAVKAFAGNSGISSNGEKLTRGIAQKILDILEPSFGPGWTKEENKRDRSVSLPSGIRRHSSGKGAFAFGKITAENLIAQKPQLLKDIGLTDSILRVMAAVSQNEGKLEAVNTYDNSFMTFGMFQWTISAGREKGDLISEITSLKNQRGGDIIAYGGAEFVSNLITHNLFKISSIILSFCRK